MSCTQWPRIEWLWSERRWRGRRAERSRHIRTVSWLALGLVAFTLGPSFGLSAQEPETTLAGTVVSASTGEALESAAVFVQGHGRSALTGASGEFTISGLSTGTHRLTVERLGHGSVTREVEVAADDVTRVEIALEERAIEVAEVIVMATREARSLAETAASVGVIGRAELEAVRPSHPSDIMNDVPGVWVNVTGGEGHMTAIRQPLTTDPVYLYLEDGVPTRSTGFFNHNALYEVNVPQSQRIEVMKGPANALYGSDAIGGVINVATRAPSEQNELELSLEGGEYGFARLLASASGPVGENGLRADLNLVRTDGWREGTDYDRIAGNLRWDRTFARGLSAKTILAVSLVDQNTAGSSALSRDDYTSNPRLNYTPISFRKVGALRLSSELQKDVSGWSVSLTPFVRSNSMDVLPNWSLTYDPALGRTENQSFGLLAKVGREFPAARLRLLGGLDLDYSPGSRVERRVEASQEGRVFTSYTRGERLYDYDVTFAQLSPYLRTEFAPAERWNLSAGVRADFMGYDYENHLGVVTEGTHRRPPDASPSFQAVSPKFGMTYEFGPGMSVFGSVRRGFRAPTEGDLFRQGSARNTLELEPVKIWSHEAGARGLIADRVSYDLSLYSMTKTDDILGFQLPDGNRETVNAGESRHRGIEMGLGVGLGRGLRLSLAYSFAEHTYEEWRPEEGVDFGGNEMEFAPNEVGNVKLSYAPPWLPDSRASLEWARIGPYWEDQANEHRYEGHDLLNLSVSVRFADRFDVFARVENLTDERYAERADYNAFRGEELAPGLPRTLRFGVAVR